MNQERFAREFKLNLMLKFLKQDKKGLCHSFVLTGHKQIPRIKSREEMDLHQSFNVKKKMHC